MKTLWKLTINFYVDYEIDQMIKNKNSLICVVKCISWYVYKVFFFSVFAIVAVVVLLFAVAQQPNPLSFSASNSYVDWL